MATAPSEVIKLPGYVSSEKLRPAPESEPEYIEMPTRRTASDDEDRLDRIERLLERSLSEPRTNIQRSTDTLRRDIGIFAILLAMMAQTGAAFYWAGGVSRAQESGKETMQQVQNEQAYTRAQLQLIDGKLQKIEGKQEAERDKRNGR